MNARTKHLTVRNVPERVARKLEQERARRGTSLNQTVIDLLDQSLGASAPRSNGLRALAGTWSAADLRAFERAVAATERIDEELWR